MSDAANRALWIVIGAALTALGVLGVLAANGLLPGIDSDAHVIGQPLLDAWRANRAAGLAIAALVGLVAVAAGLRLALSQARPRRSRLPDPVLGPEPDGATRIRTAALQHALTQDLRRYPAVRAATATLTGTQARPHVDVRLDVDADPDAGLRGIQRHVNDCLSRLRRSYDLPAAQLDVTVNTLADGHRRVR